MELHQLKSNNKGKKKSRVGRGGKKGTYSGRGMKGQLSRSGSKARPRVGFAGGDTFPFKKIHKKRGFNFSTIEKGPRATVNIDRLDSVFEDGDKVNPLTLIKKGLVKKINGRIPEVKLLGNAKISKKLLIGRCQISKSAAEALNIDRKEVKSKVKAKATESKTKAPKKEK